MKLIFLITVLAFSLRFFWHDISPPGFTPDEAVFGYNAYSLLKTGADEYGRKFPTNLKAMGDYRPAFYAYATIPFVAILGLTETATRLPSILAGTLTVLMTYFLVKELLNYMPLATRYKLAAIAALLLATSPTHLLISRYADMSSLSTFFLGLGVLGFILWTKTSHLRWLITSSVSFVLAALSYNNAWLTGPLLLLALSLLFYLHLKHHLRHVFIAGITGLILLSPLLLFLVRFPQLALRRGLYEGFLSQQGYQIRLWNLVTNNPSDQPPLITRFFYNKPKMILTQLAENYSSHFSPTFLFWRGDPHERFQTPQSGVYNTALLFILPIGFILALRRKSTTILPIWILISPLISSIGLFTPNSLHVLDSTIPVSILSALGFWHLLTHLRKPFSFIVISLIVTVYLWSLARFLHGYFVVLPRDPQLRWYWSSAEPEVVTALNRTPQDQPVIIFGNRNLHQFILFYNQVDPLVYRSQVFVNPIPDTNGFERVERFGQLEFTGSYDSSTPPPLDHWLVFDQDSLPPQFHWTPADCDIKPLKLFASLETTITDPTTNLPVYSIFYVPPDQSQAIADYCRQT